MLDTSRPLLKMALFLIGIPITIDGVEIPLQKAGFEHTLEHLALFHDGWNKSTTAALNKVHTASQSANL
jgi:hypothetical protein